MKRSSEPASDSVIDLQRENTGQTLGSGFKGSFTFGLRSAKVLMRADTDGDDNEISAYQL